MDQLQVYDSIINKGESLIVLKGVKGSLLSGQVELIDNDGKNKGKAEIQNTWAIEYSAIQDYYLTKAQDPSYRSVWELKHKMTELYGDTFNEKEIMSLVYFKVL